MVSSSFSYMISVNKLHITINDERSQKSVSNKVKREMTRLGMEQAFSTDSDLEIVTGIVNKTRDQKQNVENIDKQGYAFAKLTDIMTDKSI